MPFVKVLARGERLTTSSSSLAGFADSISYDDNRNASRAFFFRNIYEY